MENDLREKVWTFIMFENPLFVMASFRKFGILTGRDIRNAIAMKRGEWIRFMLKKAGVANRAEASSSLNMDILKIQQRSNLKSRVGSV